MIVSVFIHYIDPAKSYFGIEGPCLGLDLGPKSLCHHYLTVFIVPIL